MGTSMLALLRSEEDSKDRDQDIIMDLMVVIDITLGKITLRQQTLLDGMLSLAMVAELTVDLNLRTILKHQLSIKPLSKKIFRKQ